MSSAGQTINSHSLLVTGNSRLSVAPENITSVSCDVNNSLNNKEFSDVLGGQQALASEGGGEGEGEQKLVAGTHLPAAVDASVVGLAADESIVSGPVETGNFLPVDGLPLPVAAVVEPVATVIPVLAEASANTEDKGDPLAIIPADLAVRQTVAAADTAPERFSAPVTTITTTDTPDIRQTRRSVGFTAVAGALAERGADSQSSADMAGKALPIAKVADTGQPVTAYETLQPSSQGQIAELSTQLQLNTMLTGKADLINKPVAERGAVDQLLSAVAADTVNPAPNPGIAPQAYRQLDSSALQAAVPVEVGKPGWSDTVMQRVMWMSSQNINKAEIALDPPELGSLQVKITTQAEQTTVQFISPHGQVRDALDQGLHRLREMMEAQGLDLANVDVSGQHQSGTDSGGTEQGEGLAGQPADSSLLQDDEQSTQTSLLSVGQGLVDQYV